MTTAVLLTAICCAVAQTLTGHAPSQVSVGEQFRLTYTINTQDVKGFRAGNIPEALEVLMGPSTSRQSSFQMVNGHTSSTSSITYTYIISANKAGTYTIPPAHATAAGKNLQSNELKVKVVASAGQGNGSGQSQGGNGQQGGGQQYRQGSVTISGSDLFMKVSANSQRVYEQEPILLTYKVYTQVDLTQLDGKMPDLKSFYTREMPLPQQKSFQLENVNGRPYRTVTWQQYVMFPQTTGKLEIPSITFNGIVAVQNRYIDPFEAFFNGGSGYTEVKKQIKAPAITIEVLPLPQRPAGFSGGVGTFAISAELSSTEVKANDPVTLRVTVKGKGNMKLLKQPVVNFPRDFDTYDAKVSDKTHLTASGVEGSITYDFLAVPRHQGSYEIPAVQFVYFDSQSKTYRTVQTEAFTLKVAKGSGSTTVASYSGTEVKQLNEDIRYIKTGDSEQRAVGEYFFASKAYWMAMAALMLIFVVLFVVFRKRAIDNANIVQQRGRRANKVATRRLRQANSLMKKGNAGAFYDEVLRALWGYVGDKLNMPVEKLSRENISQQLEAGGADGDTISLFISALDECEFARYAPGDTTGNMNKVYDAAMTAISRIDDAMRKGKKEDRKRKGDSMLSRLVLLVAVTVATCLPSVTSYAVTKAEADSAYAQENYQKAISGYETLLKNGVNAELYYNLGNAYYRTDNITRAVLNYERALLLAPGDEDIRFNLQMARSRTIDKITPESEMFFVTWYRSLVNLQSVDGWARLALAALSLAILLLLVYLFANRVWLRKVGFFGGLVMLLLFVLSNVLAMQQRHELMQRTGAIIIQTSVPVKSTPSKSGTDLFVLHEGTRVTITDSQMNGWRAIRVDDGKEGWVETRQIEVI